MVFSWFGGKDSNKKKKRRKRDPEQQLMKMARKEFTKALENDIGSAAGWIKEHHGIKVNWSSSPKDMFKKKIEQIKQEVLNGMLEDDQFRNSEKTENKEVVNELTFLRMMKKASSSGKLRTFTGYENQRVDDYLERVLPIAAIRLTTGRRIGTKKTPLIKKNKKAGELQKVHKAVSRRIELLLQYATSKEVAKIDYPGRVYAIEVNGKPIEMPEELYKQYMEYTEQLSVIEAMKKNSTREPF